MASNRIPRVKPGDLLTSDLMNQIIEAVEAELPWYCNYCGGANSPMVYSCNHCAAPREKEAGGKLKHVG